jgi:predicted secreted protein
VPHFRCSQRCPQDAYAPLTGNLGKFMGGTGIGLDVPAIMEAGKTVPVDVISQHGNPTLALHVVCHGEDGQPRGIPKLMKAQGDGAGER